MSSIEYFYRFKPAIIDELASRLEQNDIHIDGELRDLYNRVNRTPANDFNTRLSLLLYYLYMKALGFWYAATAPSELADEDRSIIDGSFKTRNQPLLNALVNPINQNRRPIEIETYFLSLITDVIHTFLPTEDMQSKLIDNANGIENIIQWLLSLESEDESITAMIKDLPTYIQTNPTRSYGVLKPYLFMDLTNQHQPAPIRRKRVLGLTPRYDNEPSDLPLWAKRYEKIGKVEPEYISDYKPTTAGSIEYERKPEQEIDDRILEARTQWLANNVPMPTWADPEGTYMEGLNMTKKFANFIYMKMRDKNTNILSKRLYNFFNESAVANHIGFPQARYWEHVAVDRFMLPHKRNLDRLLLVQFFLGNGMAPSMVKKIILTPLILAREIAQKLGRPPIFEDGQGHLFMNYDNAAHKQVEILVKTDRNRFYKFFNIRTHCVMLKPKY